MSKNLVVCSKLSIQRFIKLWLSLGETPYWYHQTLSLDRQIEDFRVAKPILERFFDALEVEMGKHYDMGAVYMMGRQENKRIHFHVVFLFYGSPAETPEKLRLILRDEVRKRWKKQCPGSNPTGNWLQTRTKERGLWYLLTNHVAVGKTAKEKGKPNWYGVRNRALIDANTVPVTDEEVRAKFDEFFPVVKAVPVATQPERIYFDKRRLAELKRYVNFDGEGGWEDFKRGTTGRKGKVTDKDLMDFYNKQTGAKPPRKNMTRQSFLSDLPIGETLMTCFKPEDLVN
jgi:hypothetical protein